MSDLWGPIQPPRWMSNYETSLLNKQEGRAAAASFNEAWQQSFGRSQSGKIQSEQMEQSAQLQAEAEQRRNEMKLQTEQRERDRINREYQINQNAQNTSAAERLQQQFHEKLTPFMQSLSANAAQSGTTPYGSQGTPDRVAPWASKPFDRITNPGPQESLFGSGGFAPYGSGLGGTLTGESGPFDPTYEDYQKAKAEHPALWLDPVTAPTMHLMDQSWNQVEQTRMEAIKAQDMHRAADAAIEAKNLALDVGAQGVGRFGFRENAYHKMPSELQTQVDNLPNGGRYPAEDPLSKQLGFRPFNAAAENIMNNWLSDNNQLRIDGANSEQIRQQKIAAVKAAHPYGRTKISFDSKGKETFSVEDPKPGEDPNVEPKYKQVGDLTMIWMPGGKGVHVERKGGISGDLTPALALKMAGDETLSDEDREFLKQYAVHRAKEMTKGFSATPQAKKEKESFGARIANWFGFGGDQTPAQITPPAQNYPAWMNQPGQPAQEQPAQAPGAADPGAAPAAPITSTNAPAATGTNAPTKVPQIKSQADLEKLQQLIQKAESEGRDMNEVKKRARAMGAKFKGD